MECLLLLVPDYVSDPLPEVCFEHHFFVQSIEKSLPRDCTLDATVREVVVREEPVNDDIVVPEGRGLPRELLPV